MGLLNKKKDRLRLEPVLDGATGTDSFKTAHVSDHGASRRHDPYAWQVSHRRVVFLLRLLVVIVVVMIAALVTALEAIGNLAEEFEPKLALVRMHERDDRLIFIEPIREDVPGFDLLLRQKARRYVRLMLEIDRVTQTERFREAFRMTDDGYYRRFRKARIESDAVQDILDAGITRSITVESVERLETSGPFHKFVVDFIQTDTQGAAEIERKELRAYLTMTTRGREAAPADEIENPLGIIVLDMVLKEKRQS